MSKQAWIIFIVVCALGLGGLVYLSQSDRIDVSDVDASQKISANRDNGNIADHVGAQTDSRVVLIEYGDYQCPGCASASPVIKDVVEKYKGQITYIFRNMPLSQIHPNARAAAAAAEAAGFQGKYWEMHDKLYEMQNDWKNLSGTDRNDRFARYAAELGLDTERFATDVTDPRINQKLNYDTALAKKQGVTGTPSFFLNGKAINQQVKDGQIVAAGTQGANSVWSDREAFGKHIIEPALKDAGIALPETTPAQ